jgi:hypothetical protein
MVLGFVLGSAIAAAETDRAEGTAWEAVDGIKIDGSLDEWNRSSPFFLNKKSQMITGANFWKGAENGSATVYFMWDKDNLYIGAVILDNAPYMSRMGFSPEEADSIGIFMSTNPDADLARKAYDSTDFSVLFILDGNEFNTAIMRDMVADPKGIETIGEYSYEQILDGYEAAMTETEEGYVFEAKVPLSNFANEALPLLVPTVGMIISFDVKLDDLDMPCPGVAATSLTWTGSKNIRTDPSEWGLLHFETAKEN